MSNCYTVGDQYICTADCSNGFTGTPTASCDKTTGDWSPTSGRCTRSSGNKCTRMPPPGTQVPPNSDGELQLCSAALQRLAAILQEHNIHSQSMRHRTPHMCPAPECSIPGTASIPEFTAPLHLCVMLCRLAGWMQSGCSLVSASSYICLADCKPGYFGSPSVSCDPRTGFWDAVQGTCRTSPAFGCSGTPASSNGSPFPDPSGTAQGCSVAALLTQSFTTLVAAYPGLQRSVLLLQTICAASSQLWCRETQRCFRCDARA
jgi:hypothetical protein